MKLHQDCFKLNCCLFLKKKKRERTERKNRIDLSIWYNGTRPGNVRSNLLRDLIRKLRFRQMSVSVLTVFFSNFLPHFRHVSLLSLCRWCGLSYQKCYNRKMKTICGSDQKAVPFGGMKLAAQGVLRRYMDSYKTNRESLVLKLIEFWGFFYSNAEKSYFQKVAKKREK